LTIQPHALATRVLVKDGRAHGLEYTVKGKPTVAYADREVVLRPQRLDGGARSPVGATYPALHQTATAATSDLPDLTQPLRRPGVAPLKPLQRKETR